MARVGLVFGGRSVEHRVSIRSARTIADALRTAGHEVVPIGIAQDGVWVDAETAARTLAGDLEALPPSGESIRASVARRLATAVDVVFPIVHGTWGEDGTLQGLCEMLDLPYVGPGVTASAVAMDKLVCKRQLEASGVPVVAFRAFRRAEVDRDADACARAAAELPQPWFVKPSVGGSSVGVVRVDERGRLAEALRFAATFDEVVLVERGIVGRELECAVLGGREPQASVVGEIVPGRTFYDYEDKYLSDDAQLIAPADLPSETAERLRRTAVEAFQAVGGWGLSRVDFFLEADGSLWVNELNTLPGFTSISMYPRLWALTGISLPELVDRLVELAFERHADRRRLDDGIKDFLASLNG